MITRKARELREINNDLKGNLKLVLFILLFLYSAIIFSIFYRRSINQGNKGMLWIVLAGVSILATTFIAIVFLGFSSRPFYELTDTLLDFCFKNYKTGNYDHYIKGQQSTNDILANRIFYWLGISTLTSNALAILLMIFKKRT